jgi:hypothetical protein
MQNNLLSIIIGDVLINKQLTYRSICALATADGISKEWNGTFNIKSFLKKWLENFPNIEKPKELMDWCSSSIPFMLIDDKDLLSVFNICGAVIGLYSKNVPEARALAFNACPGAKVSVVRDVLATSEAMYLMHNSYDYDTLYRHILVDYYKDSIMYQKPCQSKVFKALNIALKINTIEEAMEKSVDPDIIPIISGLLFTHMEDIPEELFNDCWNNHLNDLMKNMILDFEKIANGRQQD